MLKSWLEPYVSKAKTNTHLLLDGGKYNIPSEKEREFLELYAKCLDTREKCYVIECRPQIFKYMIDLDIKEPEGSNKEWDREDILELTKTIQSVVYEFYEIDMNVICLTCNRKTICDPKSKQKYTKIGIHLIWPRHFTTSSDALVVREGIVQKLKSTYGERNPDNVWESIVDDRIYVNNGFRMVGSDKLERIRGSRRDQGSREPRGSRRTKEVIPENRIYWPLFVVDSKGNFRDAYHARICKDMVALILDTSIRYVPVNLAIPITKIPSWVVLDPMVVHGTKQISKRSSSKISRLDVDSDEFGILILFMRNKLPEMYKNQTIKSIQRYPDGNILIITDSKYCMNIGREHSSCGIYFFANNKGVYQKCLCPCMERKDRIFGYCRDYTSSCFEFSDDLRNALFPKKKNNGGKNKGTKINLSSTQSNRKFCKHLSSFCDDLYNSI